MIREAMQAGIDGRLSAVLTRPCSDECLDHPVIVLLSAGFAPKAGPFRMYAQLAENLANAGFACLRFDLGGLGDSVDLDAGWSRFDTTQQDIREMLDFVQREIGPRRFVLGGLCSGAEDSFHYGLRDERVVGLVLIEPHHFPTKRSWLGSVLFRLKRRLMRTFGWYRPLDSSQPGDVGLVQQTAFGDYQYSTIAQVRDGLTQYLGRRLPVHYVYTGGSAETYTYRNQVFDMVGIKDLHQIVSVDRFPEISHTPIYLCDRERLATSITDWAKRHFA